MNRTQTDLAVCPIDFLCCTDMPVCAWAGWAFVVWAALMVTIGVIGTVLASDPQ